MDGNINTSSGKSNSMNSAVCLKFLMIEYLFGNLESSVSLLNSKMKIFYDVCVKCREFSLN